VSKAILAFGRKEGKSKYHYCYATTTTDFTTTTPYSRLYSGYHHDTTRNLLRDIIIMMMIVILVCFLHFFTLMLLRCIYEQNPLITHRPPASGLWVFKFQHKGTIIIMDGGTYFHFSPHPFTGSLLPFTLHMFSSCLNWASEQKKDTVTINCG